MYYIGIERESLITSYSDSYDSKCFVNNLKNMLQDFQELLFPRYII